MKSRATVWLVVPTLLALLVGMTPVTVAAQPRAGRPPPEDVSPSPSSALLPEWAALLGLPQPYLSDPDVADAPYGWPPTLDGRIAPGEYAGAGKVTFPGHGGDVEVFLREDASYLYIAFDFPDPQTPGSAAQVFLDTAYDRAPQPQTDDYRLSIGRDGSTMENQGTGSGWGPPGAPVQWTALATTTATGWQAEFRIAYAKLGVAPGVFQVLGLSFINAWTPTWDHYWPAGAFWTNPNSWGHLVSSSNWGTFYWKPGPWQDYAPSGLPDFDQMQVSPTSCGPFAAANSLWWFDSRFEQNPVGPNSNTMPISDSYTLVRPYSTMPPFWDDHDPQNVAPLATDLATNYFHTDVNQPGTNIYDMYTGIQAYLRDHGLWDDYIVTLVNRPEFLWIAEEVMRSEDVILLLGFWQENPLEPGMWQRIGGHYVTVAGVDFANSQIAFSDPAQDRAETGWPGRVLDGLLIPHPHGPPPHGPSEHNDAGNVSHDIYMVAPGSPSPGGSWWIPDYMPPTDLLMPGLNPNPRWQGSPAPWQGGPVHTEIEYALTVSPYNWKASGRWVEDDTPLYGRSFVPYNDFAPSGVPDFDQRQDGWGKLNPYDTWQWTFCGPVAAANSLWWFDSKFEMNGATPPTFAETYPLVHPYGPYPLDDHDPLNVDDPATPWPPLGWPLIAPPIPPGQGEFVEDLALYVKTDQMGSGTDVTDLRNGIEQYLIDRSVRQGYVITQVYAPEFWWAAEEVERSEDVILLLGFWQNQTTGAGWVRLGGHYVTLAGVDKQGGYVGFSDPWFDRMETVLPPNEFIGIPRWGGRIGSDGDSPLGRTGLLPTYTHNIPHLPGPLHNDAANVSHDVYWVTPTVNSLAGGVWGPANYVQGWSQIENFWGQNARVDVPPATGDPIQTEVERAVAVSPVADVTVAKTVMPATVTPGEWVTFTIRFRNGGSLLAEDVVLTETLPAGLIHPAWSAWTSNGLPVVHRAGTTFTWDLPDLAWGEWGVITLTAQADPAISWPASTDLTNQADISTSSVEQYQVPELPDTATAVVTVQTADPSIVKQAVGMGSVVYNGDWLTFTLTYSNAGPAAATSTVITDVLSSWLTSATFTYTDSCGGALTASDRYIWQRGTLPAGCWGVITITARISAPVGTAPFPNNASIFGVPDRDLTNNSSGLIVPLSDRRVYLPMVRRQS
jgi:uncharacterized repeat protein (TIGR01451 family)